MADRGTNGQTNRQTELPVAIARPKIVRRALMVMAMTTMEFFGVERQRSVSTHAIWCSHGH